MSVGFRHGLLALAACGSSPAAPDAANPDAARTGVDAAAADAPHAAMLLGTAWSPEGYTDTPANFAPFYTSHATYGPAIAVHNDFRDPMVQPGQLPRLVAMLGGAATMYGFTPIVGLGGDPANGSWSDAGSRMELCQVAVAWATQQQPPYMFVGNEMDGYYNAARADWPNWVSELASCVSQIHAASPQTRVFTTFQLERVLGHVNRTTTVPADWTPVTDVASIVDAIGFTTYPYLAYATPADVPGDYYAAIATHVQAPIVFSEVAWTADPTTFGGSEQQQADFVERFFALVAPLAPAYAAWLWRYEIPPADIPDPDGTGNARKTFAGDGLFTVDGTEREAAAHWRAHVDH